MDENSHVINRRRALARMMGGAGALSLAPAVLAQTEDAAPAASTDAPVGAPADAGDEGPAVAADGAIIEVHQGDPDAPTEELVYGADAIDRLASGRRRASFYPRKDRFGAVLKETASSFVGMSRATHEPQIAEFLQTFRLPYRRASGAPNPFCAAGVSYVAALAYARRHIGDLSERRITKVRSVLPEVNRYHFYPTVSVINMYHVALGTRRFVARRDHGRVRPGWIVLFDWKASGSCFQAQHCGIVDAITTDAQGRRFVDTIEFNTRNPGGPGTESDGGVITRRRRALNGTVKGFIDVEMSNPFF